MLFLEQANKPLVKGSPSHKEVTYKANSRDGFSIRPLMQLFDLLSGIFFIISKHEFRVAHHLALTCLMLRALVLCTHPMLSVIWVVRR